jgi:hypothetical protein
MFNARKFIPLPPAVAARTVARAGGSLDGTGKPYIAHLTVLLPIRRGVLR